MKLPDANVLLYAYDDSSPRHAKAKAWLEAALAGAETVAFAWTVLLAFVRISTNPRIFAEPLTADEALELAASWLDQPPATVVEPTRRHLRVLADLLADAGTAGNLVTDAHLAALSIEHGAEIVSTDADFGRFASVRWSGPLR